MFTLNSAVVNLSTFGFLAAALVSCGANQKPNDNTSSLEWVQSRTNSTRYAYLEASDLQDTYLFGATVIKTDDFKSSALNMVIRPTPVKLRITGTTTKQKLYVMMEGDRKPLLSFDVKDSANKSEIDFASSGNDLRLRGLIDTLGGIYTASSRDGYWISTGAPKVLGVQQDKDTVVVDLLHTVSQAIVTQDGQIQEIVSKNPGKVTVRMYLVRESSLAEIGVNRTVESGFSKNIGFFGTKNDVQGKIQRFAVGDALADQQSITFYLKDVPTEFQNIAKSAIQSWSKAFGETIRFNVEIAPRSLDAGDPRFNVVKWFDGLDEEVGWAGVAKMMVNPTSGLVFGGHLYINGSTVLDSYRKNVAFSERLTSSVRPTVFEGTIGAVTFERDDGETPVIPYITEPGRDFDDYMQGYYEETIAHEVGHVLGLRHNFRGTVNLANNQSESVMDYAPRGERANYAGPGSYDIAAIRWGYYGETPVKPLAFCTDDDLWSYYDCNQGDWGNPEESAIHGLLDGVKILTESPVEAAEANISPIVTSLENALKIRKLSTQLPKATRDQTVAKIEAAYKYVYAATPKATLTGSELATVQGNLVKLRTITKKAEAQLKADGKL